jgi:hypothetical protein
MTQGLTIWVGRSAEPMAILSTVRGFSYKPEGGHRQNLQVAMILIGRLALVAVRHGMPDHPNAPPTADSLVRIWPKPLLVPFPPKKSLAKKTITRLHYAVVAALRWGLAQPRSIELTEHAFGDTDAPAERTVG